MNPTTTRAFRRFTACSCVLATLLTSGCGSAPRRYTCLRTSGPIAVDGRIDDAGWRAIPWTHPFGDIEGTRRPAPRYRTRAKMAWDAEHLYVAADMEEPHVSAALSERDAVVWHDNDLEVFVDPDGDCENYYELEFNALNTVFDLLLVRTYRNGGPARHDWDCAGLRSAVHVEGTLNDPADVDRGWSVEMAIPWAALAEFATCPVPPQPGDVWRFNMSRVEWRYAVTGGEYAKVPGQKEANWTWSPQGLIDMHLPERWGYLTFGD